MKHTLKLREILPRCERGIDWSAERIVLVRTQDGERKLWWTKSGKFYADRMSGTVTAPSELMLADWRECNTGAYPLTTTLQEGGRLSRKLLQSKAEKIDAFFGCPITQYLDTKYTIVIKEENETSMG